jgi:hypothetical protein
MRTEYARRDCRDEKENDVIHHRYIVVVDMEEERRGNVDLFFFQKDFLKPV